MSLLVPRSPTSTSDWIRCPLAYTLKREWRARGGIWTPNQLLGTAIGDGLSELYRGGSDPEEVVRRALSEGYIPNDTWELSALVKLALRGYERASQEELHREGDVLMVDEPLPSRARPDLVQRTPHGIVVTDTKVTLKGGFRYVDEYFTSHQLFHYAWEVGEVLGEPVKWCRIHLISLTPLQTLLHPIEIRPERLALWLEGAKRVWDEMGTQTPTARFTGCQTRYGPCEFRDACHVLDLDPDRMESVYGRVPPRDI